MGCDGRLPTEAEGMKAADWGLPELRHTHKTLMRELGTPPKLMDERMGHEDGSVQARYDHITVGMAADPLGGADPDVGGGVGRALGHVSQVARGCPERSAESTSGATERGVSGGVIFP